MARGVRVSRGGASCSSRSHPHPRRALRDARRRGTTTRTARGVRPRSSSGGGAECEWRRQYWLPLVVVGGAAALCSLATAIQPKDTVLAVSSVRVALAVAECYDLRTYVQRSTTPGAAEHPRPHSTHTVHRTVHTAVACRSRSHESRRSGYSTTQDSVDRYMRLRLHVRRSTYPVYTVTA